jgi:ABC-type multidrug transport system fused ATPase/permease subunit
MFDRVTAPQYKELSLAENRITESTFDAISNITTVIILRVDRLVFKGIVHEVEKPYDLFKRNNLLNEMKWWLTSMCCSVMFCVVLCLYAWQHLGAGKGMMMSSVFLLIRYLDTINEVFFNFTDRYSSINRKAGRVWGAEVLAWDFTSGGMVNHVLPKAWKKMEIRGLNFSYHADSGADLHLKDVALTFPRGAKIAFVGLSGGGKTTTLKIIRGLYRPQSITLLVDGVEIFEGFEAISQAIALVPQAPEIFASTIRKNITMGAEYSPEQLEWCMDMACFTEVLAKLPKGLESSTKEKGVNLSAGQNQRLALARALLACLGKDIVLLDEPTSSLDKATEATVYENIFSAFPDKTVVSSIHQLHLLSRFDYVYVFEDGKVAGEGTLETLLDSCPEFQRLWSSYNQELSQGEGQVK